MLKQDIRIYIYINILVRPIADLTSGPIGMKFFCRHSGVAGGCYRLKQNLKYFFLQIFSKIFFFKFFLKILILIIYFQGQRRALQLVC